MNQTTLSCTDWLAHRWPMTIERRQLGCEVTFAVIAGGYAIATLRSEAAAASWMKQVRPTCLAELVASHRSLHPAIVTITSAGARIGRIRPELWGSYDALRLAGTDSWMTALSAKARAAFPDRGSVIIQVNRARGGR